MELLAHLSQETSLLSLYLINIFSEIYMKKLSTVTLVAVQDSCVSSFSLQLYEPSEFWLKHQMSLAVGESIKYCSHWYLCG